MCVFRWVGLCAAVAVIAACGRESPQVDVQAQTEKSAPAAGAGGYQKPGAALRFRHDYDGRSEPGEPETLQLSFDDGYEAGTLSLDFEPDEGLQITPANPQTFTLAGTGTHEVELQALAAEPGKYYLRIFAEVLLPDGRVTRRVFALALQVGDVVEKTEKPEAEKNRDFRGDTLIRMPADEQRDDKPPLEGGAPME